MAIASIASALEQNTSLERLDLSYCDIDDDGIQKLTSSLKKSNSTLQNLNLEGNYISSSGIFALLKCVYDTTSMTSLWESNHTVRSFYKSHRSMYNKSFPETNANCLLLRQLVEVLATCNRRYSGISSLSSGVGGVKDKAKCNKSKQVGAYKILKHYVKEERTSSYSYNNEYWETVEGIEEKLIPNILSWLVRYGDIHTLYGVVIQYHAALFSK